MTPEEAARDYLDLVASAPSTSRTRNANSIAPRDHLSSTLERVIAESARRSSVPRKTRTSLQSHAKAILRYLPGDRPLMKLTVEDLVEFVLAALRDGRSANTILEHDLPLIARAFRSARMQDPMSAVKRALPHIRKSRRQPKRLSWERIQECLARIRASDPERFPMAQRHADFFELAAYTGVRHGELSRLSAQDVEVDRGVVHVRLAKLLTRPRAIPVPATARPLLARLRALGEPNHMNRPFWNSASSISSMQTQWRVRLEEPLWSFRTLRRSYASTLLSASTPLLVVRDLLGHSDFGTTSLYAIGDADQAAACVERVLGNGNGDVA